MHFHIWNLLALYVCCSDVNVYDAEVSYGFPFFAFSLGLYVPQCGYSSMLDVLALYNGPIVSNISVIPMLMSKERTMRSIGFLFLPFLERELYVPQSSMPVYRHSSMSCAL